MTQAQEWLNNNYSQEKRKKIVELVTKKKNLEGSLVIENFDKLEIIELRDNDDLTSIRLTNLLSLKYFNANNCQLDDIEVNNCPNIVHFNVGNNLLKNTKFLNNLSPKKLSFLSLHSNNFERENLSFLSRFVNLEQLYIDNCDREKFEQNIYNRFYGSLKPLSNLKKLKWLCVSNTEISEGLEYLPNSLRKIGCNSSWKNKEGGGGEIECSKILKELEKAREFLGLTEKEMKEEEGEEKEEWFVKNYYRLDPWRQFQEIVKARISKGEVKIAASLPLQLKKKKEAKEDYDIKGKIVYNEVYPTDHAPFFWQTKKNESLSSKKLPLKLYNIKKDKVEEAKNISNVENYAMVSYVWGSSENKKILSQSGTKSLKKAIETCNHLGIEYLWMDQLCIDQDNVTEKSEEIPKMRRYYNNTAATLIAIHTFALKEKELGSFDLPDILRKIIGSEWFSRSWTFQEGFLSRQTIFMFDDILIDGRAMAALWALHQPSYTERGGYNSISEFNEGTKKIATPVGWTYYRNGYDPTDAISLSLNQALRETRERKRQLPVDGIYSIIGLLSYGEKVEVDYSLTPSQVLFSIMKIAVTNGYGEPLSWHGESNEEKRDWLPTIDKNGSVNIKGGIIITCEPESLKFDSFGNIEVEGSRYKINDVDKILSKIELGRGFIIDGGMCMRDITLKLVDDYGKRHIYEKITLMGSQETLEKIKKEIKKEECFLLILNKEKIKGDKPFALLVRRESNVYCRLGLVELFPRDLRKLRDKKQEKIIIRGNNLIKKRNYNECENKESRIEIPAKQSRSSTSI